MTQLSYPFNLQNLTAEDVTHVMQNFEAIKAIINGGVTNDNVAPGAAIAYAKLALANSIVAADIAAGAVGTSELADLGVTLAKLAANSVDQSKLTDGAVGSPEIIDGAVAAVDLAGASVGAFFEIQVIADDATAVTLTDGGLILNAVSCTLPAGWTSMDVLLNGQVGISESSANAVRGLISLRSPPGVAIGQPGDFSIAGSGTNLSTAVPLTGRLVGLTANQTVEIFGQRTLVEGPVDCRQRYLVALKIRKS